MKTDRFLAIETSSARLSLAGGTRDQVLAAYHGSVGWRHADTLFENLEQLMKKLRWHPKTLTGVVTSVGPGSFTGIRIGLSAARALGQAQRIPVAGINALETIAHGASARATTIAPVLDALRGQVFTALYQRSVHTLPKRRVLEQLVALSDWQALIEKKLPTTETLWIAGNGASLILPLLSKPFAARVRVLASEQDYPKAESLLELAPGRWRASYKEVVPLYLRKTAAEERRRP